MSIFDDIQNTAKEVKEAANQAKDTAERIETQVGLLHSKSDLLEAKMISQGIDIRLLLAQVEKLLEKNGEVKPPPFDVGYWRGNFLATPNYPFAFMYPTWTADARKSFRQVYRRNGHTHLPLSMWANYAGQEYNYYNNVKGFRDILIELKEAGIEPCLFVITDAVDNNTQILPSDAANFCNFMLPKLKDLIRLAALGWELNQVKGWTEKDGDVRSGHHMIDLSRHIRWNLPTVELFAHFQPNWWAPHYEGHSEVDWWKDAVEVNGLLHQIKPESSLSLTLPVENEDDDPASEDGLYLALKYKGARPDAPGIAGRIRALGRKYVMFEHSRELSRWEKVVEIVKNDPRVSGYC